MKKMVFTDDRKQNFSRCPCPIRRKVTTLCSYHDEGEQTIFGITRATGPAEFPRAGGSYRPPGYWSAFHPAARQLAAKA
jgi:hypothetical protein